MFCYLYKYDLILSFETYNVGSSDVLTAAVYFQAGCSGKTIQVSYTEIWEEHTWIYENGCTETSFCFCLYSAVFHHELFFFSRLVYLKSI